MIGVVVYIAYWIYVGHILILVFQVPTTGEMVEMWKRSHNLFGILCNWYHAKVMLFHNKFLSQFCPHFDFFQLLLAVLNYADTLICINYCCLVSLEGWQQSESCSWFWVSCGIRRSYEVWRYSDAWWSPDARKHSCLSTLLLLYSPLTTKMFQRHTFRCRLCILTSK